MSKQYFEKLNTEKLAEFNKQNELQKFEFGIIDDLQKDLQKLKKVLDITKKQGKEGAKIQTDITSLAKKLDKLADENFSTRKDATTLARDLGLTREKALKAAKDLGLEKEITNNPFYKGSLDIVDEINLVENQVSKIDITYIAQ